MPGPQAGPPELRAPLSTAATAQEELPGRMMTRHSAATTHLEGLQPGHPDPPAATVPLSRPAQAWAPPLPPIKGVSTALSPGAHSPQGRSEQSP